MNQKTIQALLEGAYAQTPTLPGFFLKYDEFRSLFNQLVSSYSDVPVDVEKILHELYPDAKYEEAYQPQDSEEVFKAFRIAPNKLIVQKEFKKKVEKILSETVVRNPEGWFNFAVFGQKGLRPDCIEMGFPGIRPAIEKIFGKRFEFRAGDTSNHEAPVLIRDCKHSISKVEEDYSGNNETRNKEEIYTSFQNKTIKQGSYIGDAINQFAFFPKPKGSVVFGWDAAINDLATNLVQQDENWFFDESDRLTKPILKNYLSYTFERLQYEDEQKMNPRAKILINAKNAVWNTGLVDAVYDSIYAFFERNDGRNPKITQPWIFLGFGTANSYYQKIITDFPYRPEAAQYFNNPRELFYDITASYPTYNKEHIFRENIERLPLGFLKKGATEGFQFEDNPGSLPRIEREAYFERLANAIYADEDWLQFLNTRFNNAMNIALRRVAWNYKTAIPIYYPSIHKMQLLLPLALEKKDVIDVALVCNHKYDESANVNNYEGKTIFTLQMAYTDARLITRPDSDWLMAYRSPIK